MAVDWIFCGEYCDLSISFLAQMQTVDISKQKTLWRIWASTCLCCSLCRNVKKLETRSRN